MKQKLTDKQEGWVVALEGNRYVQTRRKLRDSVGYCCLGVICDIEDPNGWTDNGSWSGSDEQSGSVLYWYLPDATYLEYGLSSKVGRLTERVTMCDGVLVPMSKVNDDERCDEGYDSLVGLNDGLYASFTQIATFIRTYPEIVFVDA